MGAPLRGFAQKTARGYYLSHTPRTAHAFFVLIKSIENNTIHNITSAIQSPSTTTSTIQFTMMKSSAFTYIAMSLVAFAQFAGAFYHGAASTTLNYSGHVSSSTKLYYRALHHGPDVPDHPSNIERESTKMDKDKIRQYGPGDFAQYVDHDPSSYSSFDGGDSEMGLAGDGNLGLRRIGRDVSPHMTRTLIAKVDSEVATVLHSTSYADELLSDQHNMDVARAQQLENWATQNEIAIANRYSYLNEEGKANQGHYTAASYDNADEVSECTIEAYFMPCSIQSNDG
jgi:hypothetical protein